MSRGGFRGGSRGGGGRGGGRGGGYAPRDTGPPETVIEFGTFIHAVESEMLCSCVLQAQVPHFNAPIYLSNKSAIGKVDEILGPINEVFFSVKMNDGCVASSFKQGDKVFGAPEKVLPLERFLPKPKVIGGVTKRGRGGAGRGGRGGSRGGPPRGRGFGPPRGGRGGFASRGRGDRGGFGRGGGGGGYGGGRGRGGFRGS